jgi:hypothetical protein
MALSADKILADLKAVAQPELEKVADDLRATFLKNIDEFVDSTRVGVLDDLLVKAAKYEISAVMSDDPDEARQYATAAEDVLRQVSVVLVSEKVVSDKQVAAMIQATALIVWGGFKSVASSILGAVIKGALTGLLGSTGGAIADAAGTFLEDIVDGDDSNPA